MGPRAAIAAAALALLAGALAPDGARAGSCPTACPPPPPCNCVPTTHQVRIPGVEITPPSINVVLPTVSVSGGGWSGSGAQAGAEATATATANATGSAQASSLQNLVATQNYVASGGGGGGYVAESGPATSIGGLNVETPAEAFRQVCLEHAVAVRAYAIQALCLDDRAIPHPASQTHPDRDVADGFEGELFRCIAGTRLQYTVAAWSGAATFEAGQSRICQKGEALWRFADGRVQCRPQLPARDCNERSLLRRYGAGIKVVRARTAGQCLRFGSEAVSASAAPASALPALPALSMDGGVGP